jgi:hypothetical protein
VSGAQGAEQQRHHEPAGERSHRHLTAVERRRGTTATPARRRSARPRCRWE